VYVRFPACCDQKQTSDFRPSPARLLGAHVGHRRTAVDFPKADANLRGQSTRMRSSSLVDSAARPMGRISQRAFSFLLGSRRSTRHFHISWDPLLLHEFDSQVGGGPRRVEENLLPFHDLSERHPGLTPAVAEDYAEAARVCLDRHHASPILVEINNGGSRSEAIVHWSETTDRERAARANAIDTTEAGAYGIALGAVELARGMVAVRRAETGTGADYYIAPLGAAVDDLENCLRLEVSGVDNGDERSVRQRLVQKRAQARAGASNLPALAAIVGFAAKLVVISPAEAV